MPAQPGMGTDSLDHSGDLLGILAAEAQQHEERADLMRIGLAAKDHAESDVRFLPRQGPRSPGAAPECRNEPGELSFVRDGHRSITK